MVGKRVLLVEDEFLVRSILAETLKDEGYEVVEADDGEMAARLIDAYGFDVVVTDVQMPGRVNGIEVGQRARLRKGNIPIIYVTGRPESMVGVGGLSEQDVFLPKPYGPHEVIAIMRRLLRSANPSPPAA